MAVISYKCPNCGGELMFEPSTQKYACEYCLSSFEQSEVENLSPETAQEENVAKENEGVLYTCPSCGAEIVTDDTTAATFCYYCHSPVVLSGRVSGQFMPDYIIPFVIDKKAAEDKFVEYVGKKKFVPKGFFNRNQIEKLSGVYFPYWMYNCKLNANITANASRIRRWRSGSLEYIETKRYRIERGGNVELKNISRNALQKANRKLAEGVFPYNMSDIKEFHMGYLSGFQAEKRDIEQQSLIDGVRAEAKSYGSDMLRDTIDGYASVSVHHENYFVENENWKYTLMPVWTVTYPGVDGKVYYYSMNGQTGEVVGEFPIDKRKVAMFSGIIALIAFVIAMTGGFLL